MRSGRDFDNREFVRVRIMDGDVGECSADVDGNAVRLEGFCMVVFPPCVVWLWLLSSYFLPVRRA